jgi:hypothetical protein
MSGALLLMTSVGAPALADFSGTLGAIDAAPAYNANALITLDTDGLVIRSLTPAVDINTAGLAWLAITGAFLGFDWWVRATLSAGVAPSSGNLGVWEQLTSARSWTNNQTVLGTRSSTLLFEFARSSGGSVLGSSTVVLEATAE